MGVLITHFSTTVCRRCTTWKSRPNQKQVWFFPETATSYVKDLHYHIGTTICLLLFGFPGRTFPKGAPPQPTLHYFEVSIGHSGMYGYVWSCSLWKNTLYMLRLKSLGRMPPRSRRSCSGVLHSQQLTHMEVDGLADNLLQTSRRSRVHVSGSECM